MNKPHFKLVNRPPKVGDYVMPPKRVDKYCSLCPHEVIKESVETCEKDYKYRLIIVMERVS